MPTVLDTPILHGDTATKQKIYEIKFNLEENIFQVSISNESSTGALLSRSRYSYPIWTNGEISLPSSISTPAKTLYQNATNIAKNQGWIGAGTTTDDI